MKTTKTKQLYFCHSFKYYWIRINLIYMSASLKVLIHKIYLFENMSIKDNNYRYFKQRSNIRLFEEICIILILVQPQNAYPPSQSNFINCKYCNELFNPQTYKLTFTDAVVESAFNLFPSRSSTQYACHLCFSWGWRRYKRLPGEMQAWKIVGLGWVFNHNFRPQSNRIL